MRDNEKYMVAYEKLKSSYVSFYEVDENAPSFRFLEGKNSSVIFSCPHAVSQFREGKEKLADINTGPLGIALNSLGYKVLIKTKNCGDDANYDSRSQYKDFLSKIVKTQDIKYVIDLHGMSKKRNVLISLGTCFGKNSSQSLELTQQFIKIANKNNLDAEKIRIDFPFSAHKNTVASTIRRKNKIETLQIEMNSKLYDNQENVVNLIKTLDEYAMLVKKVKTFKKCKFSSRAVYKFEKQIFDKNDQSFKFKNGNGNILLSAPHSQSMIKEGRECYQETFSGALAYALAEEFDFNLLYKQSKTDYDSTNEYLENVKKAISDNKIDLVIEFHVMNKDRYEDISIITNHGFSIGGNFELMSSLIKILSVRGFSKIGLDYPFNAFNFSSTVSTIFKETGIPSFQFIINEKVFYNKIRLKRLLVAIEELIKKISCII